MINYKEGVQLVVSPSSQIRSAWERVDQIYQRHGLPVCTITSVLDGVHWLPRRVISLHYRGQATDFRTHDLRAAGVDPQAVANEVKAALGPSYGVLLEFAETEDEHLHVQWRAPL